MKNYFIKLLNLLFPREEINKNIILKLLEKRNFLNRDFFSLLPYNNIEVKKTIRGLKFKNNTNNAVIFGEILLENLPEYLSDLELKDNFYNPILITIPLPF